MKSGFVTIIGEPNVGKSTLLNSLIDFDVAITSSMKQTTRNQIKGIYTDENAQIIFIDTPGIHKAKHKLGHVLNKNALQSLKDVEIILLLVPINKRWNDQEKIQEKLDLDKTILVLTKIDLVKDQETLDQRALWFKNAGFKDVIGVSNKIDESLSVLKETIIEKLPEGKKFYEDDNITDVSVRFMCQEIIRESVIKYIFEEIPHSLAVVIDQFVEVKDANEQTKIKAYIYVEKTSQKMIVIGQNGQMIKKIGSDARQKIMQLLKTRVHLDLSVKVDKNWTNDEKKLKKMGY